MTAPVGSPGERADPRSSAPKSLRWLTWLAGIAMLAAVIITAQHFSDARDFARLTERAEPWWLALAVLSQIGTYLAQGQVFRLVARAGHFSLGLSTACRLGLTKLFVDQAIPSAGLSGTVVLANGFERRGMARPTVAAAIVVDLASYYAAYVFCLAAALVIVGVRGETSTIILLVTFVFFLFAIALTVFALALSGRGARSVSPRVARIGLVRTVLDFVGDAEARLARNPRLLLEASFCQLAIVLCDTATIWVLIRSLGGHGSVGGVFASFMISSLLRTVGFMPGGLGFFEAGSVVTLRMVGIPVAVALAATLLFRGLSFWLPLLPGLWLCRQEMSRRRPQHVGARRDGTKAQPSLAPLLEVENLFVGFGRTEVLRDLSFRVAEGSSLAIIGPNGSGKTVLFKALIGSLRYQGRIRWAPSARIGYVPQKLDLERDLPITGLDLLRAKAEVTKSSEDIVAAARAVSLANEITKPIGALSGGQFQRLLLALALVGRPTVLLLDEPTAGVDEPGQEQLNDLVHRLRRERGLTVLLISHELSVVHRYATDVLCLSSSKRACFGPPRAILTPELLNEIYGAPVEFHVHDA